MLKKLFNIEKKENNRIIITIFGIKMKFRLPYKHNYIVLITKDNKKIYNPKIKGLNISFSGNRNIIKIYEPCPYFLNTRILATTNTSVTIKPSKYCISNLTIDLRNGYSKVLIDEDLSIASGGFCLDHHSKLKIGKNCMMSENIWIRTGDIHTIIDNSTGEVIKPQDIIIGDNVWIGLSATILKKSVIPSNCIIGTNALVAKKFDKEFCAIAGNPAKVIKENISWLREPNRIYMKKLKEKEL